MNEQEEQPTESEFYIPVDKVDYMTLWEKRARLPGFRSVMSLRLDEGKCLTETLRLKEAVFNTLGDLSGKKILEVGTGVGRFTDDLASQSKEVYSIDISRPMLNRSRNVCQNSNISFLFADAGVLPFQNQVFDLVFEVTLLTHVVDDKKFTAIIDEAKRTLKPLGTIFFCGPLSDQQGKIMVHRHFVLRTLKDYVAALDPLRVVSIRQHLCADQTYSMILAKRF